MQSIHLRLILSNSILFTHKRKGNGGGGGGGVPFFKLTNQ
jgi:hypothetical protein